jgi:prepilin-type N-terminal cleavage/methylation domain-containing protein
MHDPSTRPATSHTAHRRVRITSDLPSTGPGMGPAGTVPRGGATERPRRHLRVVRERAAGYGEDGFTLIELLVVVLMLVALVGIAVPSFIGQRDGAEKAAVQSELRTAAIALESHRAITGSYGTAALTSQYGFVPSLEVATAARASADTFCVVAWYDPNRVPGPPLTGATEMTTALARTDAWAISPSGMRALPSDDASWTCP